MRLISHNVHMLMDENNILYLEECRCIGLSICVLIQNGQKYSTCYTLLRDTTQRLVVIPYGRFGKTYRSRLQGWRNSRRYVVPKRRQEITTIRCVITQKSTYLRGGSLTSRRVSCIWNSVGSCSSVSFGRGRRPEHVTICVIVAGTWCFIVVSTLLVILKHVVYFSWK
jgi:hypothetical protein